jgi:hypothetical protein
MDSKIMEKLTQFPKKLKGFGISPELYQQENKKVRGKVIKNKKETPIL